MCPAQKDRAGPRLPPFGSDRSQRGGLFILAEARREDKAPFMSTARSRRRRRTASGIRRTQRLGGGKTGRKTPVLNGPVGREQTTRCGEFGRDFSGGSWQVGGLAADQPKRSCLRIPSRQNDLDASVCALHLAGLWGDSCGREARPASSQPETGRCQPARRRSGLRSARAARISRPRAHRSRRSERTGPTPRLPTGAPARIGRRLVGAKQQAVIDFQSPGRPRVPPNRMET
jgi:hypothetical protein